MGLGLARRFGLFAFTVEAGGARHGSWVCLPVDLLLYLLMLRLPLLRLLVKPLVALEVLLLHALFANLGAPWAYGGFKVVLDLSFASYLVTCGFLI